MKIHWNNGEVDGARVIARSILEAEENVRDRGLNQSGMITATQAEAYAVLGFLDKALQKAEDSFTRTRWASADDPQVLGISAISLIDTERAVELAFAAKVKHPNWNGFDHFAAYHLSARPLLVHPKVQEYYVKEGKWIDYLAERVPEYAKYKNE